MSGGSYDYIFGDIEQTANEMPIRLFDRHDCIDFPIYGQDCVTIGATLPCGEFGCAQSWDLH